jgi:ABC-2 type transport system ATP-binding protein
VLDVRDLHKRYGDVAALDGCTLRARPGRMAGLLGRNGAGKTTLMRAVFGLLRPDAGEVRWRGRPIAQADRAAFGYMPEERGLYPKMRVADHLAYVGQLHGMPRAAARAAARRWLEDLDLADRADGPVEALSQGNQQRVQLAAALLHEPTLLVLDEPFNGLDPIGAATMARVLRERAAAGTTVVFSSHQLDVVEDLCEDVVILDRGRVVLAGELQALQHASPHRVVELEVDAAHADAWTGLLAALGATPGPAGADTPTTRHRVVVGADVDVLRLLAGAEVGGLRRFAYTTPSLGDLFAEALA